MEWMLIVWLLATDGEWQSKKNFGTRYACEVMGEIMSARSKGRTGHECIRRRPTWDGRVSDGE